MPTLAAPKHTVVLDNGSGMIKVGFAGEKRPRALLPASASAKYPVKRGLITDWRGMVSLWKRVFQDTLRVGPRECSVLMVEAPATPKEQREQTTTAFLERLGVPRFYLAKDAAMTARALDRETAIVLDMGDGVSHVSPVRAGQVQGKAVRRFEVAGRDLSEYMRTLMLKRGAKLPPLAEVGTARELKERVAYVALDYDEELAKAKSRALDTTTTLPGGEVITVGAERFRSTEPLFKPNLLGLEQEGIHRLAVQAIMACDVDIRKELYGNIILAGGSTLFEGIAERMHREIKALAPDSMTIKIIAPPERQHIAWTGASGLASLSTFEEMWITKDEYDESGPGIVHRKCT